MKECGATREDVEKSMKTVHLLLRFRRRLKAKKKLQ